LAGVEPDPSNPRVANFGFKTKLGIGPPSNDQVSRRFGRWALQYGVWLTSAMADMGEPGI
jgi:hypothetical protein